MHIPICMYSMYDYDYDYGLIHGKGDACKPTQIIVTVSLQTDYIVNYKKYIYCY